MEALRRRVSAILILSLAALVAYSPMAKAAGSLEPSAPPGPVMKSLDEVEPRIPIKASDLPLTITQRGSYYLTGDVNFTDTAHHAITVGCNDVTIDLKGYTIAGPNATNYSGIYMNGRANVEIRNGTLRDFRSGIYENSLSNGKGHRIINIRVISNVIYGIYLNGYNHLVRDCTVAENGSNGIELKNNCTVTGNIVSLNNSKGIHVETGCTVNGNAVSFNTWDGIMVYYMGNTVTSNKCFSNGYNSDGAGIRVWNPGNHIEGNYVSDNDRGIEVVTSGNLIVKNVAVGNTVNYVVAFGNRFAEVSSDPNTAEPWANF